jgi:hypothetical protein
VEWSRSGRRLIATVERPTHQPSRCCLSREQADELSVFLADVRGSVEFVDPDDPHASVSFEWNGRVNRLIVTLGRGRVELRPFDLRELARFLA